MILEKLDCPSMIEVWTEDRPSIAETIMGKMIEQLVVYYKARNNLHFPEYDFEYEMPRERM